MENPKYRFEPVPFTGKKKWSRRLKSKALRQSIATTKVNISHLRAMNGRKAGWFTATKLSQRVLPAQRRGEYRSERYYDGNWKSSFHCRKQWQKHKTNNGRILPDKYWNADESYVLLLDAEEAESLAFMMDIVDVA